MAPHPCNPSSSQPGHLITQLHLHALKTPTALQGAIELSTDCGNNEDSSSSDSSLHPSRTKTLIPGHARSRSNPLPPFLDAGAGSNEGLRTPPCNLDSRRRNGVSMSAGNPSVARKRGPTSNKDFTTGTCMTCASLMRWPKELTVFRCTICATINDLISPGVDAPKLGFLGRRCGSGANIVPREAPKCQPISIQHSRILARQCIHSYFLTVLRSKQPLQPTSEAVHDALPSRPGALETPAAQGHRRASRNGVGRYNFDTQPTLRSVMSRSGAAAKSHSPMHSEMPPPPGVSRDRSVVGSAKDVGRAALGSHNFEPKRIFKRLEDYVVKAFASYECVSSSFALQQHDRDASDAGRPRPKQTSAKSQDLVSSRDDDTFRKDDISDGLIDEIDGKMLLLGDVAENGLWWTGGRAQLVPERSAQGSQAESPPKKPLVLKSPNIDWDELGSWYHLVTNAAEGWLSVYEDICTELNLEARSQQDLQLLERDLLEGQSHVQRVLLKATESLLKRPGRRIADANDLRFILLFAENPMLHPNPKSFRGILQPADEAPVTAPQVKASAATPIALPSSGPLSGQHSGIVKRITGLISNAPAECHNQLILWYNKYDNQRFSRTKDLISGFLSYRLLKQMDKKHSAEIDITAGLIPEMRTGPSMAASYLYDEIRAEGASKKREVEQKTLAYTEDWQIRAASRVLALLFAANNSWASRHGVLAQSSTDVAAVGSTREYIHKGGQLLPTSDFYNSIIDYADLVKDFESWELKRSKFSFCQYPFLMSIWAKTRILEHDARRQMQMKARHAFLDSIMTNRSVKQYLSLLVRRECLVEDSLAAVSEVIGSGSEDIKKGLRITFKGEEGIDGGGLRKEWFLLLIREVFNPEHGMFLYDEDSHYCYFNPNTFETSDQFFLVGVVMGLAIYNSTILDVALPPFAFRKLLAAAPAHGLGTSSRPRPSIQYTLEDLAEYRPRVAHALRQLLDFEGDVEDVFGLDFVIDVHKFDAHVQVPLCSGGERKPVTNRNRREYVELYIRYLLDTAVIRQFEPFKRGFYTVCGGNAFSLFRPEEIELLIRGSDEALDVASLRAIAEYDNWGEARPDGSVGAVTWFWETFEEAPPVNQRKLLSFITGSDRIPATGAAMLPIKLSCLGEDVGRFPIARTCFNMLSMWTYASKERLETMLWRAVFESEGFGLK